ncbi:E3 ubiquitin-protein ligase MGRN1 isoform X2 [Nilaparvata lugens]|uniref:E3 ubiquitin-protein ligase MGRN1 isoform X2 n=1 Tax=Nilaparvata lugens TaxID=108931 RepID=UPI00193D6373|nr:E3 ubiquitin-protein ligase MGRN1 isoform X2 [Nilaparvata lugens]
MGALTSRQNAGVEEVDIVSNHAYKYPPKSGNYFGNHFIMGGEKFDTPQPEAYLFGENADLNFLGSRPTPFPYPPPQANEPTKTLKSLVNIRKESLRLVRALDDGGRGKSDSIKAPCFNIEFTFDCDARTAITIYYFAQEEITPNGVVYVTKEPSHSSETFYYKRGTGQLFSQPSHVFDPSQYTDEQLSYNPDRDIIPIAIHCVAQEGTDELRQSHTCIAVVDRHSDGSYVLKTLKQKLFVDGLCYLLQEIYGIENKTNELIKGGSDDDTQDNGSECVICICEVRDTLILPCRHLCLCNSCADSLRYQASSCPICRAPFRALLQIRALQKATQGQGPPQQLPTPEGSCENIPAGYEAVSLIEALNGPCQRTTVEQPTDASDHDASMHQAADVLNRSSLERIPKVKLVGSPEVYESEGACPTPEFRMSVLLSRGADSAGSGKARNNDVIVQSAKASSPLLVTSSQGGRGVGGGRVTSSLAGKPTKQGPRDTVRVVNETSNSHDETDDVDSEAEKLSPLLTSVVVGVGGTDVGGGRRPPDDTEEEEEDDTEEEVQPSPPTTAAAAAATLMPQQGVGGGGGGGGDGLVGITAAAGGGGGGEDSDYYTPEDPATTILSPLHTDKIAGGRGN